MFCYILRYRSLFSVMKSRHFSANFAPVFLSVVFIYNPRMPYICCVYVFNYDIMMTSLEGIYVEHSRPKAQLKTKFSVFEASTPRPLEIKLSYYDCNFFDPSLFSILDISIFRYIDVFMKTA